MSTVDKEALRDSLETVGEPAESSSASIMHAVAVNRLQGEPTAVAAWLASFRHAVGENPNVFGDGELNFDQLAEFHQCQNVATLVASDPANNEIMAGVTLHIDPAGCYVISNLFRLNKYRGFGIGSGMLGWALWLALQNGATCVTLRVRRDNSVARELYLSAGFEPCEPPLDTAEAMWLYLPERPAIEYAIDHLLTDSILSPENDE